MPAHRCPPCLAIATSALAVLLAGPAGAAPALRMLVYPVPGLFDVRDDGGIGGPGGDLLNKIGPASGVAFEAASLPIARAWSALQGEPQSCVLGMSRTPEREDRFQWVGVISRAEHVVYARADSPAVPQHLAALRGRPVVVVRETATAAQLREQGVAAQEVGNTLSALRMLQAGRVDYWFAHQLVAEPAASAAGGTPIKPLFSAGRIDGYLACNLAVPAATVNQLRQGLQRLRRNGDLAAFGLR